MTDKPTPEQIQRACDLANAQDVDEIWEPDDYGQNGAVTALVHTIAQLDAVEDKADAANVRANNMQAERDKARADLGEIATRICNLPEAVLLEAGHDLRLAVTLARPYRQVETDPLVAIEQAFTNDVWAVLKGGHNNLRAQQAILAAFRTACAELAKRGLEIGRSA